MPESLVVDQSSFVKSLRPPDITVSQSTGVSPNSLSVRQPGNSMYPHAFFFLSFFVFVVSGCSAHQTAAKKKKRSLFKPELRKQKPYLPPPRKCSLFYESVCKDVLMLCHVTPACSHACLLFFFFFFGACTLHSLFGGCSLHCTYVTQSVVKRLVLSV